MSDINFAGYIDDAGKRFIGNFQSDGPVGPPGYSPVKGTDYFTEEDITEIKDLVKTETGCEVAMSLDPTTFVLTISLITSDGTILNTETIDLPIEAMIINGSYDSATKTITLTLQSGNTIDVPIGDVINGLQEEITNDNKLSSDLVDDTGHINKFVTEADKTNWNGKADNDTVVLKSGSTMTGGLTTPTLTVGTRSSGSTVGTNSFAQGKDSKATGSYSFAEGSYGFASGNSSHAEGSYTNATGNSSHAEGSSTTASAYTSHAEGSYTTASANNAHAEGNNTIARRASQHVEGEYNIQDSPGTAITRGDFVHIVGNGTDSSRSNAHTLDWSGNAWFAGDVYVGSTSGINKDEGSKKLAKDEDVQELETNVQELETKVEELEQENAQLLDQIPVGTATGETITVNDSSNLPLANFEMIGNATQEDTPTPETPQAIHVVTGDVQVNINSGNLLDEKSLSNATYTTSTYKYTSIDVPRNITLYGRMYLKPNKTAINDLYVYISNNANPNSSSKRMRLTNTQEFNNAFSSSDTLYFQFFPTSVTVEQLFDTYNFEISVIPNAPYVPYKTPQSVILPLGDIELAKIGNYTDRIYKDNGKWYLYKALGEVALKDINISYNSSIIKAYFNGFRTTYNCAIINKNRANGLSTHFTLASSDSLSDGNLIVLSGGTLQFRVDDITSLEDYTTWLNVNNPLFYYQLGTPTTTEITDTALITALEQVLAMTTYKTTTNAFTLTASDNATPTIVAEYRQDIGTLISNLNNAILSLGNNV